MTEHSVSTDKNLKTREEIARQSISNISDAISTVVSHSTNDEFRNKCFSLLEVPNSSSLAAAVSSKLTSISTRHHHCAVSLPFESTTQERPPVVPKSQKNSQQSATMSSLQEDQEISELQPTDSNDDFDLDFNDEDFFDEETAISETVHQIPHHESNVATSSSIKPPNSLKVPSSPFIKEDWFDEVLDTDLFFNES